MSEFRGTVLTAQELVRRRVRSDAIFPVRGPKVFYPTDSWLEGKQLQSLLDATKDLLREERVERESLLARAEWDENLKIARVTRLVGNQFQKFGHEEGTTVFLHPEESLYLLETNNLEILYGGVSMSIQQAYMTLLNPKVGCTFLEYIVFSHLLKNGFKVLRHCPKRTVTRYERLIGLHTVRAKSRKAAGKNKKCSASIFSENNKVKEGLRKSNKENNVTCSIKRDKRSKRHKDFKDDGESEPLLEDISCVEVTIDNYSSSFSDIEILSEKSVKDFKSDDMEYNDDCSFSGSEDSDCQVVFSKGMENKDYGKNNIEEINLSDSDESVVCGENSGNSIKIEPSKTEVLNQPENQDFNFSNKVVGNITTDSICEISRIEGNFTQNENSEDMKETENRGSLNICDEPNLCDTSELPTCKIEDENLSLVNNVSVVSGSEIFPGNACSQGRVSVDSAIKEEDGSQNSDLLGDEKAPLVTEERKSKKREFPEEQNKIEVIDLDVEPRILEDRWTILDSFPNAAGFHTVHCSVPPPYLCPSDVKPSQSVYTIVLERLSDPRFGGSHKRQCSNSNIGAEKNDTGYRRCGYIRHMSYRLPNWHSNRSFNKRFSPRHRFRGHQHRGRAHRRTHNHQDIRFPSNSYSPGSLMYPPLHSNSTPQRHPGPFPFYPDQSSFGHSPYEHNRRSPRWRDHSHSEEFNQHSADREYHFQDTHGQQYPRRQGHSYRTSLEPNRIDEPSTEPLNEENGSFIPLNLDKSHEPSSFQENSRTHFNKRRKTSSEETSDYLCSRGKYPRRGRERNFTSRGRLNYVTNFLNSVASEQQNTSVQNSECYHANRLDVTNVTRNSGMEDYSSSEAHSSDESNGSESSNVSNTSDESMDETEGENKDENIHILLKPEFLTDIDEALNSLQLIRTVKLRSLSASPEEPLLSIKFDLYLPSTHFRKSEPPVPDFRVVVMSPDQTLPSSRQLAFLEESFDDDVPLLFAIASADSVAFFLHSSVTFPQVYSNDKVQT